MIITAKFSSECPNCHERLQTGSQVEWKRGKKAKHVVCPALVPEAIEDESDETSPGQYYDPCDGLPAGDY